MSQARNEFLAAALQSRRQLERFFLILAGVLVSLIILAFAVSWIVAARFNIRSAKEVELSPGSITIVRADGEVVQALLLVHANQMVPDHGIVLHEGQTITVEASGLVSTLGGADWGKVAKAKYSDNCSDWPLNQDCASASPPATVLHYAVFKDLIAARHNFTELPQTQAELLERPPSELVSAIMAVQLSKRFHDADLDLSWRRPDGRVYGGREARLDDPPLSVIDQIAGNARVLANARWGTLLATIAGNSEEAYENIRSSWCLQRPGRCADAATDKAKRVFAIEERKVFTIKGGSVITPGFLFKPEIARYDEKLSEPRIYFFVNDGFVTRALVKDFTDECNTALESLLSQLDDAETKDTKAPLKWAITEWKSYNQEYALQSLLFDAAHLKSSEATPGADEDDPIPWETNAALNGLWYLNNRGMYSVVVTQED